MGNQRGQAERLSKLQKFVLVATYKKTVLKESLPKIAWWYYQKSNGKFCLCDYYFDALYESDTMLNYFGLSLLKGFTSEEFAYDGGSTKERISLHRSLNTLSKRGYIEQRFKDEFRKRMIVTLTEKGKETASKLDLTFSNC